MYFLPVMWKICFTGVETLLALEEIDASENCLIDHSCLGVFNKLHSLRVVSIYVLMSWEGNGLYITSAYREDD